ncbi:MAG: hypothetical protein K2Z81_14440 [Cyanobacteria bacterium]|nr:hypothetical protein [Cyanobacteriota bacterium]
MSAKRIERTMRRMLNNKRQLNNRDAMRIRELILEDGYISKSEKKLVWQAMENDLLECPAIEIFHDLLNGLPLSTGASPMS